MSGEMQGELKPWVVILGGGESGVGAALLAQKTGNNVFVSDSGTIKPQYKKELEEAGIDYEEGGHERVKRIRPNVLVKSPGIPEYAPIVKELSQYADGNKVLSEISFACRHTAAKKIFITGSNGKTTTTLLTYHLMKECGKNVEIAGNVGVSMARKIYEGREPDWWVVEMSSFQLDGMQDYQPYETADIAVLTNITPDHLDRYDHKFENYIRSKFGIVHNRTCGKVFVCNADDPVTMQWIDSFNIQHIKAQVSTKTQGNICCTDGVLKVDDFEISVDRLPLKGLHNIYNIMQALAAAKYADCRNNKELEAALLTFKNAEHRLEPVRTLDGVDYINDSKATNVDSAWYALECQTRPVVWIAGGTDKGNDYSTLHALAREKVKALVCLGIDNKKLFDSFGGIIPTIVETRSMDDCVAQCRALASDGDVVLLSPCCASFDLFNSYVHRGNCFKEVVNSL